jgi:hypothetical protein
MRMIMNRKGVERSTEAYFKALSQYLTMANEENHEILQSRWKASIH